MSIIKKTGRKKFNFSFFSSKEKRRKKNRTEGVSKTLYELGLRPTPIQEQCTSTRTDLKNDKKVGKAILCFIPFFPLKEKRKKARTKSLTNTLYELGLNHSPTQEQYARTKASVKKELRKESISSSSSLPVSLL